MVNPSLSVRQALADGDCLADKRELFGPLKLMYDSLVATGARRGEEGEGFGTAAGLLSLDCMCRPAGARSFEL